MQRQKRIIVTGSNGRVGRAICTFASKHHRVVGIDLLPGRTTSIVADISDCATLAQLFAGADAVIHSAALHAPHVGIRSDDEFNEVNVEGTIAVAKAARASGIPRMVFTSTTAVYGAKTDQNGAAEWIDSSSKTKPRTIYHYTKLAAEKALAKLAGPDLQVPVLRIGRCFPEKADLMALYRLHRGIDTRDVASAHLRAIGAEQAVFSTHIICANTPFERNDCIELGSNAQAVISKRCPGVSQAFAERGWGLPSEIDRVYDNADARKALNWEPRFGYQAVLDLLDSESPEVLRPHQHQTG